MSNGKAQRGRPPIFPRDAPKAINVGSVRLLPADVERLDRLTHTRAAFLREATLEAIGRGEREIEQAAKGEGDA